MEKSQNSGRESGCQEKTEGGEEKEVKKRLDFLDSSGQLTKYI